MKSEYDAVGLVEELVISVVVTMSPSKRRAVAAGWRRELQDKPKDKSKCADSAYDEEADEDRFPKGGVESKVLSTGWRRWFVILETAKMREKTWFLVWRNL